MVYNSGSYLKTSKGKTYLATPTCPHIVVATNRLAISHEAKVHSWAYQFSIKGQVHPTHRKQGALWDCHNSINVPIIQAEVQGKQHTLKYNVKSLLIKM